MKRYCLALIILIILLTACSNANAQNNTELISNNLDLSNKLKELEELSESLQNENEKLKCINNNLKEEVKKLEEISKEKDGQDYLKATIVPINELQFIDGCAISISEGNNLIQYEDEEYISFNLIKEIYGYQNIDRYLIKGFPLENYVVKTDGILYFEDYIREHGEKYDPEVDFERKSIELDGIKLEYGGEMGVVEYVITKPVYMTQRGITVGSSRNEVRQAYGQLGLDSEEKWNTFKHNAEYSVGAALTFVFEEDKVKVIYYGYRK